MKPRDKSLIFEDLEGTVVVPEGVDLTKPACPEWAEMIESGQSPTCAAATPVIHLDGSRWLTLEDMFDSLLPALGAPDWHGRNYQALVDSIGTGSINAVEPPYILSISGAAAMAPDVLAYLRELRGDIERAIQHGVGQGWSARDACIVLEGDA